MGTAEKNLYKGYQKLLKEKGIKQLTNEEMEKCYRRLKKKGKNYEQSGEIHPRLHKELQ